MIAAGLLLGVVVSSGPSVHTSTADVRDCAISEAGHMLAATDGGVVVLPAERSTTEAPAPLTALDGLPGTRAEAVLAIDATQWWAGTEGGLARVRLAAGVAEVVETIDGPAIKALAQDEGDSLWVGTWGQGVMRLADGRLRPVAFADGEPSAARLRVNDLVRFENEWVVATAAGLWRGDASGLSRWSTTLDETLVWSLDSDGDRLWVGTLDGLYRGRERLRSVAAVDARDVVVGPKHVEVATMGQGIWTYDVSSARRAQQEDQRGLMVRATDRAAGRRCIATDDGLWLEDASGSAVALRGELPSNDISAAAWDAAGERLWVGTFDQGLAYHDADGWHRVRKPGLDPQINGVAVERRDGRSIVWIATARGVARLDGDDLQTWTPKSGLPHEHVLSIAVVDDHVVAGTARGFVRIIDGKVVRPRWNRKPKRWAVWSVAADEDGTLWLGTTEGLVEWPKQGPWRRHSMLDGTLPDNWITSVKIDDDGLWVGTYAAGVVRLRTGDDGAFVPTELSGGRVNPAGLTVTSSHVYAATMGGLQRRSIDGSEEWTSLTDRVPGVDTTVVVETPDGLWVGTRRGLVQLRR